MFDGGRFISAREREGLVAPPDTAPDINVREHLLEPLATWAFRQGIANNSFPRVLTDRGVQMCLQLRRRARDLGDLIGLVNQDPDLLIDIADWIVRDRVATLRRLQLTAREEPSWEASEKERWASEYVEESLSALEAILSAGGSAWTVDGDDGALLLRVSAEEREILGQATAEDDSASTYLKEGWAAAWQVKPDGQVAMDKAVKALEAAFCPVATPNDPSPSLGKAANALEVGSAKWCVRFEPALSKNASKREIDPVLGLAHQLRMVFQAQHRHASEGALENTLEEGRDAITLAVSLVALQRRGFLSWRE